MNPRVEYKSVRRHTFISAGRIRALVDARPRQRWEGSVVVGGRVVSLAQPIGFARELMWCRERMLGGAHLAVVQVRVGRHNRPLGGLWIRQLDGLVDGGVDGASERIANVGKRPMGRVPRVMHHFIIQRGLVAKGLGGVIFTHRDLWTEDKGRGGGWREEGVGKWDDGGLGKRIYQRREG